MFNFSFFNLTIDLFNDSFTSVLFFLVPEIYLFMLILVVLCYVLALKHFSVSKDFVNFTIYLILPFLLFLLFLLSLQFNYSGSFLNGHFFTNSLVVFSKILIVIFATFVLIMSLDYFKFEKFQVSEYTTILLLAVIGMFLLVSSNDFIVFYLSLELQSFCLYILASLKRYSNLSIEAALKYFILGSFSSGILLFGISLLYGFFGTTNFFEINNLLSTSTFFLDYSLIIFLGLLFISVGILFKLAIFPFHFWIADVYEGSPMIVTAFFAIVPKLSFLIIAVKLYFFTFVKLYFFLSQILFPLGLFSIIVGILLSLYATKMKRLLAYSAITHMGYIIVALSLLSFSSIDIFLIYIITYVLSSVSIFSILLSFRKKNSYYKIRNITELSIMLKSNPLMAFIFSLMLLSSAGIPPLAGFFGKFYVFSALLNNDSFLLAGIIILLSVVSSIYYIRLIRFIYFSNPNIENVILSHNISWLSSFMIVLTFYLNLFFIFFQGPLLIFVHTLSIDFWNSILWLHYIT